MDIFEIEELAAVLTNTADEERNEDDTILEDRIYEKYDVDFSQFAMIVEDLLPMIEAGKSPLTGKTYKGFGRDGVLAIKIEVV